jgi:hypothetical protein
MIMDEWNRNHALQPDAAGFEPGESDRDAKARRAESEKKKEKLDDKLDQALEDSFPGSDPVSIVQPPPSARDKHKQ